MKMRIYVSPSSLPKSRKFTLKILHEVYHITCFTFIDADYFRLSISPRHRAHEIYDITIDLFRSLLLNAFYRVAAVLLLRPFC